MLQFRQMLKRDGRLFLRGLIPALVLTILLLVACAFAAVTAAKGAVAETEAVKVALVDNEDSVLSRISITMVSGQSYMSSLMKIEQTDYDSAIKGIADGRYSAAVILPEDYMTNIMHGVKTSGQIIVTDAVESDAEILKAISDFGSRLLAAGQYGVFAGERIIAEDGLPDDVRAYFLENSNTGLINFALNAYDMLFSFKELPYSNTDVSLTFYYAACWITLLLFVCGLFFPDLYTADCRGSIYARLRTRYVNRFDFLFGKLLYPFLFRAAICIPFIFLFGIKSYVMALLAAFFITLMTGCVAVSLSKRGGWVVSILGFSAVFLFMAGGMVPRTMLPEMLPKIAAYTPYGAALQLITASLGGSFSTTPVIICAIYSVAALLFCLRFLRVLDTHSEEVRL